jgi:hypothetical protein
MRSWTVLLMIALTGCFGSKEPEKKVTQVGVDPKKDPLGALGAIGQMAKDAEKAQKEMENLPVVEAVHFSKLIEALPDVPSGWKADDAKGESNQMGDIKISQASRNYSQDGGEGQVRVIISDWAYNRSLFLPFLMQANFSQESTEGYSKGIKIGEDPGREEYQFKARSGKRNVLVRRRYNVEMSIQNLDAKALDEWWGRVKAGPLPEK